MSPNKSVSANDIEYNPSDQILIAEEEKHSEI